MRITPETTTMNAINVPPSEPQASSTSELAGPRTFLVDPERLEWGAWDHALDRRVGEGDIAASYSADKIASNEAIRKPFTWEGRLWVTAGMGGRGRLGSAEAYRLVSPRAFNEPATTYKEKTQDCEAARNDPKGFYHGMQVRHKGETLIICGPPAIFRPGEKRQFGLFDF